MRTEKLPLIWQDRWEGCYQRPSKKWCLTEANLGENESGDNEFIENFKKLCLVE